MKIAIIGKICSGKTTTADILIGLNNDFQKLSFAGKVKVLLLIYLIWKKIENYYNKLEHI